MKPLLKSLVLSCIVLWGCTKEEGTLGVEELPLELETPANIESIIENGVTIDSIALGYANIYTSSDGFPVIEPSHVEKFTDENEILIYFDFISKSRDSITEYYQKLNELYAEQGLVIDYGIKYQDKLERISVEVKKNDGEFIALEDDSEHIRFIPTPEIDSGYTFARYFFTLNDFTMRYGNSHFPEFYVLSFDDKEASSNTYVFKVTFDFNNEKEFILYTDPIAF